MDRQEFTTFTNLYVKLQEQCKHVAKILSEYNYDFSNSRFNTWLLDYDCHAENNLNCYTEVPLYTRDCNVDKRSLFFPTKLLYATDDQIHKYAQEKYKK